MTQSPSYPVSPALRLRRFLHVQGLRLEPWAAPEQILDAFLAHLARPDHDDEYWGALSELGTVLARDLERHRPDSALTRAVAADAPALLAEVRSALARVRADGSGFRALGRALSGPAMSLLLLVSLATVGCGGDVGHEPSAPATGGATAESGGSGAGGVAENTGGAAANTGGTDIVIPTGGTPPTGETGGANAGGAGGADCRPDTLTITQLLDECVEDEAARAEYLAALAGSHPDWAAFVADYFRCTVCGEVSSYISQCYRPAGFETQPDAPTASSSPWDLCAPIMVYLGVRFA